VIEIAHGEVEGGGMEHLVLRRRHDELRGGVV